MKSLLNIYGVTLSIQSDDTEQSNNILSRLLKDFYYFKSKESLDCFSEVNLYYSKPPDKQKPKGVKLFKTKMSNVYGLGSIRICDYGDDNIIWSQNSKLHRLHNIYSENTNLLYEMAYTTILSIVGEALDNNHIHRLHALGISINNKTGILLLPSGGGKSSIGLLTEKYENVKIFSDETPLIKNLQLFPYPVRIAIRPELAMKFGIRFTNEDLFKRKIFSEKVLIPIQPARVATPSEISFVLIGKSGTTAHFRHCSRLTVLMYLFVNFVVGVGIAQMAEHMLRFENIYSLIKIAFSRLKTARLISKIDSRFIFEMSPDMNQNCNALVTSKFTSK